MAEQRRSVHNADKSNVEAMQSSMQSTTKASTSKVSTVDNTDNGNDVTTEKALQEVSVHLQEIDRLLLQVDNSHELADLHSKLAMTKVSLAVLGEAVKIQPVKESVRLGLEEDWSQEQMQEEEL